MAFTTNSVSSRLHQSTSVSSITHTENSTLNHLSGMACCGILGAWMLWRRDPKALWAATGSVPTIVISFTMKNIIKQPRPFPQKKLDPGMPSSHAQAIFYVFTFFMLSIVEKVGIHKLTLAFGLAAAGFSSYLASLRVLEKYHTPLQVLVGATIGTSFSILWHWSWEAFFSGMFESTMFVRIFVIMGAGIFWLIFMKVTISTFWGKKKQ